MAPPPEAFRIFFRDKKGDLKGPFTERQVQEWYRKGWYESATPFCFLQEGETPSDSTPFLTLNELRSRGGVGCPFASSATEGEGEKEARKKMELQLEAMEKDLAELSARCSQVAAMEKRMEDIERRIKDLATAPSAAPSGSAAAASATAAPAAAAKPAGAGASGAPKVPKAAATAPANKEYVDWATKWASLFIDLLHGYRTGDYSKMKDPITIIEKDSMRNMLMSEEAKHACADVIEKKTREIEYFYCALCDTLCQNTRQIFMHVAEAQHGAANEKSVPEAYRRICSITVMLLAEKLFGWASEDHKFLEDAKRKYGSVNVSASHLRPTLEFIDDFTLRYGNAVCDYTGNINSKRWQIVTAMMPRLKQDNLGRQMMSELHAHIGDHPTHCYECEGTGRDTGTGTRAEYYRHLLTYDHIKQSNAMDLVTLVVNMYQKSLIEDAK